jgi:hypothetical protein
LESPFASVLKISRGHSSLVSLIITSYGKLNEFEFPIFFLSRFEYTECNIVIARFFPGNLTRRDFISRIIRHKGQIGTCG